MPTSFEVNAGSPLASFIKRTIEQTTKGLGDWELKGPIELELNTIVKGGLKEE